MTLEQARVLLKTLNNQVTSAFYGGDFWVEEGTFEAFEVADAALRDMLKRREGCWHCHGIEAHEIEYVTELKNAYQEYIKAPEAIPYRHCANCGRELSGNAEQVEAAP